METCKVVSHTKDARVAPHTICGLGMESRLTILLTDYLPETTNSESCQGIHIWRPGQPFAQPFECPSLLVVSHRAPRTSRPKIDYSSRVATKGSPLIGDVFVCCTRFLRMYIHRVSSRHWPSPLTDLLRGSRKACRRQGGKLANGEEPKEARRECAIAITTAIIWGAPGSL